MAQQVMVAVEEERGDGMETEQEVVELVESLEAPLQAADFVKMEEEAEDQLVQELDREFGRLLEEIQDGVKVAASADHEASGTLGLEEALDTLETPDMSVHQTSEEPDTEISLASSAEVDELTAQLSELKAELEKDGFTELDTEPKNSEESETAPLDGGLEQNERQETSMVSLDGHEEVLGTISNEVERPTVGVDDDPMGLTEELTNLEDTYTDYAGYEVHVYSTVPLPWLEQYLRQEDQHQEGLREPQWVEQVRPQVEEQTQNDLQREEELPQTSKESKVELQHQGPTLPEPPPYDFLEELETWIEEETEQAQMPRKRGPMRGIVELGSHNQANRTQSTQQTKEAPPPAEKTKLSSPEGQEQAFEEQERETTQFPTFVKEIKLRNDPITGKYNKSDGVFIPKEFLQKKLASYFPKVEIGDYFQIRLTNLRTGKSGIDTRQIKTRFRLYFPELLSNYFEYRSGDSIKFEFQKHFPKALEKKVQSVNVLARFIKQKGGGMFRVSFSTDAKKLTGLKDYKTDSFIHWQVSKHQGVGRLYKAGDIGIASAAIGLIPNSPDFYTQLSVHRTRLTPELIKHLGDKSRSDFIDTILNPIRYVTGIQFTGRPQDDKQRMLEYILGDLTEKKLFDDIEKVKFRTTSQISENVINPIQKIYPDGIIERVGKDQQEIIELKAFAPSTPVKLKEWEDQFNRYKAAGIPVNAVTTQDTFPEQLRHLPDRVYTYKDVSKMVVNSKNPISKRLLDLIRQNWP